MIIEDRDQNPYRPEQLVSKRNASIGIVLEEDIELAKKGDDLLERWKADVHEIFRKMKEKK